MDDDRPFALSFNLLQSCERVCQASRLQHAPSLLTAVVVHVVITMSVHQEDHNEQAVCNACMASKMSKAATKVAMSASYLLLRADDALAQPAVMCIYEAVCWQAML